MQDLSKTEKVNVDKRVAKADRAAWVILTNEKIRKLPWLEQKITYSVIIMPTLLSGLAAIAMTDTGMESLEDFQENTLKRFMGLRSGASMLPIFMTLSIWPVKYLWYSQVLALAWNVWCLDGPCKTLIINLLKRKDLKR